MVQWKMISLAVALQLMVTAGASSQALDQGNAHHYQGGPKTGVPHLTKHPGAGPGKVVRKTGGHHYRGGPRAEPHHMGDEK